MSAAIAIFVKGRNMTYFRRFRLLTGALAAILSIHLVSSTGLVQAESCLAYDKLAEFVEKRYLEKPFADGLIDEKVMIQLFRSEAGSWTLAIINTDDVACIIASGSHWERSVIPLGPGT